jgi:acyl-CoA thioester hydrolase
MATDALSEFPVVVAIPVQWGDQDAFGHVNNTVYFRWCESGRIGYFDRLDIGRFEDPSKVGPILAAIHCNFRQQLTFPDTIRVGARITGIGRSSISMQHLIVSESLNDIAADSESTIVLYDYVDNRPHAVPDPMRRAMEALEGRTID